MCLGLRGLWLPGKESLGSASMKWLIARSPATPGTVRQLGIHLGQNQERVTGANPSLGHVIALSLEE